MTSSKATEVGASTLATALERIADVDRQIAEHEGRIKELKRQRDSLEEIATEEMVAGRLDGVRAAGRSWRVGWEHSMSVPADRMDAVLAAARAAGVKDATLLGINTARLKTVLKEMATATGRDARLPWADGTPFAGLVGEYVRPKLHHTTLPQK